VSLSFLDPDEVRALFPAEIAPAHLPQFAFFVPPVVFAKTPIVNLTAAKTYFRFRVAAPRPLFFAARPTDADAKVRVPRSARHYRSTLVA
jgi:hypothetical protein